MRLLGEDIKFRENLVFSINRYSIWWIILIITMCFDYLSTTVFVEKYGSEAEANLTTRFMMDYFSPYFGNLFGKVLQLFSVICMVGLNRRFGNFFLLFVILINCWAIVVNSISWLIHTFCHTLYYATNELSKKTNTNY